MLLYVVPNTREAPPKFEYWPDGLTTLIVFVVVAPLSVTFCKFWVARSGDRSVVVETPFTDDVIVAPDSDNEFEVIMDDVAVTPLITDVSTFPEADWVNELMKLVNPDAIPLIMVWKELVVVERVLELTRLNDVVAVTPLVTFVSSIEFVEDELDRVFVVDEASIVAAESVLSTPSESATTIELVALPTCNPSNLTGSEPDKI